MSSSLHYENIEKYIVSLMIFDKEKREKFIEKLLPNIFYQSENRFLIFLIRKMHKEKIPVSIENIVLLCLSPSPDILSFLKKNGLTTPNNPYAMVTNIISYYESSDIISDAMVNKAIELLYEMAFKRYVNTKIEEISGIINYEPKISKHQIMTRLEGINRMYKILFENDNIDESINLQLNESMDMINNPDEYIPTFSENINRLIGGFTRKSISTIIGKSGHNKTTFSLFNALYTIRQGYANSVVFISTEEDAPFYWRRIFAMILDVDLEEMRKKEVVITKEHLNTVKSVVGNKIKIVTNIIKYKDIVDALYGYQDDVIYIDHLQNIIYPGNGTFLTNMIGGIPALISIEKQVAKLNNNVIVNLSQVNDKEIQTNTIRKNKSPRYYDAYASSSMYQGSREFLSIWYPIKDIDEYSEDDFIYTPTDVIVSVEKSNFTRTGRVRLKYIPAKCYFEDYN